MLNRKQGSLANEPVVAALFLSQNNALNSATTLYTVFFGIKYAMVIVFVWWMLTRLIISDFGASSSVLSFARTLILVR